MSRNIFAYTPAGMSYPGYVSISRDQEGNVAVTVRAAPTLRDGVFVCGFSRDRGLPGRCTPGDERCNNYCNMAPQVGPMQPHPVACQQVIEGVCATFTVPAEHWPFEEIDQ
jgi:hypothetical protein